MPSIATQTAPMCVPVLQRRELKPRWLKRMARLHEKAIKHVNNSAKHTAQTNKEVMSFVKQMSSLAVFNAKKLKSEEAALKSALKIEKAKQAALKKSERAVLKAKQTVLKEIANAEKAEQAALKEIKKVEQAATALKNIMNAENESKEAERADVVEKPKKRTYKKKQIVSIVIDPTVCPDTNVFPVVVC